MLWIRSVYGCGANHQGQLGTGDTMPRETFTCVPKLKGKAVDFIAVVSTYTATFGMLVSCSECFP